MQRTNTALINTSHPCVTTVHPPKALNSFEGLCSAHFSTPVDPCLLPLLTPLLKIPSRNAKIYHNLNTIA